MNPQVVVYDPDQLAVLQRRLSPERFATYLVAAAGDAASAMRWYDWNVAVSSAVWADLQRFEVILRNAMNEQLVAHHTQLGAVGFWFDRPKLLTPRAAGAVRIARERIKGKPEGSGGAVIAELGFAFWRYLLAPRYTDDLWTPALRHAFPHLKPSSRDEAERPVKHLHKLRNRIAHCEPIFSRNLRRDYEDLLLAAGYICLDSQAWIAQQSTVETVLAHRP